MIELARERADIRPVKLIVGDMSALPFPDNSFDLVTTGYGLRNVPNLERAIDELFRVLRPGGRALSLDFNKPRNRIVCSLYLTTVTIAGASSDGPCIAIPIHTDIFRPRCADTPLLKVS